MTIIPESDRALPEHLEIIVVDSYALNYLIKCAHVFPAPGEPVTGRTAAVQHDIATNGARPVWCGPHRLAPAGLRTAQTCIKDMLKGGQIEPSDSPRASPVVLVTCLT